MKKLMIVSGATGSLGVAYLEYFSKIKNWSVFGISRSLPQEKIKTVNYLFSDFLKSQELEKEMKKINYSDFDEIIFIHPVGKFKFEEHRSDEIDKNIYDSNVNTFINIANILLKVAKSKKLVFCCFGSVSDKYNMPYWGSYTKSKQKLKEIMKELSNNVNIRCVFVNVTTVSTKNENNLRPFADETYWLNPKTVVAKTVTEIVSGKSSFIELDVIEPNPNFKNNYYLDHNAIYKKWKKEMGKK